MRTGRRIAGRGARAIAPVALCVAALGFTRSVGAEESERPEPANVAPVVPPALQGEIAVDYPEAGVGRAEVAVKLLVNREGAVDEVLIVEGSEPFASAARDRARRFRFTPARRGEEKFAAWILLRIEFLPPTVEPASPVPVDSGTGEGDPERSHEELEVRVEGVRRPGVGRVMSDAETQIIPGAEGDPVRSIEAMPGVVPILASGPFLGLRGASPGMVGYQYDGIALPFLFHLARGPAVVHPWMVDSAALHNGGAPARLGGSAGGFVEAKSALPTGHTRAAARVRLTDSALGAEVPVLEGKGAVLLAGRYSYTRPLVSLIAPEFSLNYWDYQGRFRYSLTPRDQIEVLTFGAGDRSSVLTEGEPRDDLFFASFHRASVRYTHHRGGGAEHRISLTAGHDRWDGGPSPIRPFTYSLHGAVSSTQPLSERTWFEAGVDGGIRFQTDYFIPPNEPPEAVVEYRRDDTMAGTWIDFTHAPSSRTTMAFGVRFDLYSSTETELDDDGTAGAVQPRLSLSHQASDVLRLHNAVGLLAQPRSTAQRPPGRMYSIDGGLEHVALSDLGAEFSLPLGFTFDTTVFHNAFFNVGDIDHLRFMVGQDPAERRGRGQSYGLEVSLRRMFAQRLRGFVSYTLSRSWRSIGRVRGLAEFDRPHVVDAALAYYLGQGWNLSSRATYYRGYPARMGNVDHVETAPRAQDHYQLDWQAAKRWEMNRDGAWWGITFGVLNTTLRSESKFVYCNPDRECVEELVGPATIPTFGVEGEM